MAEHMRSCISVKMAKKSDDIGTDKEDTYVLSWTSGKKKHEAVYSCIVPEETVNELHLSVDQGLRRSDREVTSKRLEENAETHGRAGAKDRRKVKGAEKARKKRWLKSWKG